MKKIAIALAISATVAFATWGNSECEQKLQICNDGLDQIAEALAKISQSPVEVGTKEVKDVVCHDVENLGSEEIKKIEKCISDCWDHHVFDSQIKKCTLECTKKN